MANWIQRFLTAIATHKAYASVHHAKYTNTNAVAAMGAKADGNPLHHDKAAALPSGLIVMWHGLIANIPTGWVICDGNNSTPNLLTRFIEGVATAATNPGTTGGATSHKHTMGAHKHTVTVAVDPTHVATGAGTVGKNATYDTSSVDPGDTNTKDGRPKYYDVAFLMKT